MRHEGLLFKNPDTASDSPTREEAKAKKNCRDNGEKGLTKTISSGSNFHRVESGERMGESLDEGVMRHPPLFESLGSAITTKGFPIRTHTLYPQIE